MTGRRTLALLALLASLLLLPATGAGAARIVAIGDVHGEIDGLDSVLRTAGLIDGEGRWVGGDTILVQTGDMTDRGTEVRAVMDRMRSLREQAPEQGGRVVGLLGNHEISNLIHIFDFQSTPLEAYTEIWADFADQRSAKRQRAAYKQWYRWLQRYPGCVKQENRDWAEDRSAWLADHPEGFVEYLEALSAGGEYGAWLRSLNVAALIDGSLFLHGGTSPELLERGYQSAEDLNRAGHQALEQLDADRRQLVEEELIVPFSSLWEVHCALFVEIARLEESGGAEALVRRRELERLRDRLPGTPDWFLTNASGPLWYRGLAQAEEADLEGELDRILEAFGARRVAVGHTPQDDGRIRPRFGGRVYLIDTAMAYPELGGRASALEIDGERVTAIYADERVVLSEPGDAEPAPQGATEETDGHGDEPPHGSTDGHDAEPLEATNGHAQEPAEVAPQGAAQATAAESGVGDDDGDDAMPHPVWRGPDGEPLPFTSVEEVLDFLTDARVKDTSKIPTGVTLPRKVELELDGVHAHAIFHHVAIEKRRERLRGGRVINFFRDHYANNIAAFELSRMLGMHNVPPAVERKIGTDKGSLQLWIEGAHTEAERREKRLVPPGDWRLTAKDMVVFDNLTNNIDRNQGNILYDADWNLWFIDHTRTFGRTKKLPAPARVRRCSRALFKALQELDEEEVRRRLKPHLGVYEIKGLMERRDRLVALIQARIAADGEDAVLFDYGNAEAASQAELPEIDAAPEEP